MSGKKKEMKIEFRLLCDIMAKTIFVKAGSFDAITQEKFLMIAGITCGVQSSAENIPNLELGESTEFPSSKILTEKTVHRYIILNEKVGGEDVTDAPRVKRTPPKKAVSKKRPVVTAAEIEPVVKKKRTTKSKPVSSKAILETLPVEAIPLQMIAPTTAAPTEQLPVPKRPSQKRKRRLVLGSEDEFVDSEAAVGGTSVEQEPAVEHVFEEQQIDDVDDIIQQILTETSQVETDEEIETIYVGTSVGDQKLETFDAADSRTDGAADYFVEEPTEELETVVVEQSADEAMSLEDIFLLIPVGCPIPSAGVEITKITLGKSIKIPGVDERTWYMASLPQIPVDDKGKKPLLEKDPVKGNPMKEQFFLIVVDIDLLVQLREQIIDEVAKFFYSFSLKRLANLKIDDYYYAKEELVLSWAEAESTGVALQRRILPQIPVDDKGKKPLLEKDPVKGNPVKEQFLLIVADIDLLVQLREQIIDEVAKFFYSFSLKRLANLKIDDSYYAKEELVLSWAEAESTGITLQRRMYILLKYREMLIRKFLEARKINFAPGDGSSATDLKILDWLFHLHLFVLEELKEQSLVHGLCWDKMCCYKVFEGRNRDHGAVIARSNTNTKSSCWIRTMLRVDGTWVIEPCADYWKPIPREVTSSLVVIPSRLSYVDTLPPMSEFFKLLKKRWGDVCIEVAKFFTSGKVLLVGSVAVLLRLLSQFPVLSLDSRQYFLCGYFSFAQFCSVQLIQWVEYR
ncbi:hypothetical protein F511_43950 [Dorcoceras hygrometricum]|uniref:Splicing factor 3B subunit 1-like n=1 Tax=Dorcoceras hygrometricum TaxID=472368 RepID=A0A2Z7BWY2_9LAMI|nr:hypothetical protein F511_43950 [Dorcoceras hygrometricum]